MSDTDNPDPERWWRHRRWQSYVALAGVIGVGGSSLAGLVPDGAAPVAQSVTWALVSVVILYHGGAAAVDAAAKMRG